MKLAKKMTKAQKTRLLNFVMSICKRPSMFVGGPPDFQNLTYFLDGYLFATEDSLNIEIDRPFRAWLATKFKAKFSNYSYSAYIKEQFKTEKMRFKKLPLLFEQFLNSP